MSCSLFPVPDWPAAHSPHRHHSHRCLLPFTWLSHWCEAFRCGHGHLQPPPETWILLLCVSNVPGAWRRIHLQHRSQPCRPGPQCLWDNWSAGSLSTVAWLKQGSSASILRPLSAAEWTPPSLSPALLSSHVCSDETRPSTEQTGGSDLTFLFPSWRLGREVLGMSPEDLRWL